MQKLRCGVIGLGMGRFHVAGYISHPNAEVVSIADMSRERLDEIGEIHHIGARYTDAEEMLQKESLDIVSVATPNAYHKPLTLAAFKAGCHVICEKPMALNAREGKAMVEAAKKAGKRLMINFSYRFYNQSWALKQQVEAGLLGKVYYATTQWHRRRGIPTMGSHFTTKALSGGGPLIDLGVHRLDLALWLMGYPKPVWVMGGAYDPIARELALQTNKTYDVEDFAAGQVRFEDGATLTIEASWASNRFENEHMETRLYGDKGGLVQHNINQDYQFEAEMFMEKMGSQLDVKVHSVGDCPPSAMHHFVDCIVNDKPHTATGEEALIVQEILDAIYASAQKGAPVRIKS